MPQRSQIMLCPYCGHTQKPAERCGACGGLFERLSRMATQISMGPWYIRDKNRPFRPGCSYQALTKLIKTGQVTATTILRGPTTRQFWSVARNIAGVAHLVGYCHRCRNQVEPGLVACPDCAAMFLAIEDRNELGIQYPTANMAANAQQKLDAEIAELRRQQAAAGAQNAAAVQPFNEINEAPESTIPLGDIGQVITQEQQEEHQEQQAQSIDGLPNTAPAHPATHSDALSSAHPDPYHFTEQPEIHPAPRHRSETVSRHHPGARANPANPADGITEALAQLDPDAGIAALAAPMLDIEIVRTDTQPPRTLTPSQRNANRWSTAAMWTLVGALMLCAAVTVRHSAPDQPRLNQMPLTRTNSHDTHPGQDRQWASQSRRGFSVILSRLAHSLQQHDDALANAAAPTTAGSTTRVIHHASVSDYNRPNDYTQYNSRHDQQLTSRQLARRVAQIDDLVRIGRLHEALIMLESIDQELPPDKRPESLTTAIETLQAEVTNIDVPTFFGVPIE